MPSKGKVQLATTAPRRRVLRAHSKLSVARTLRVFFANTPIPKFNDQVLEAYVKAVAPNYDSELEPIRFVHNPNEFEPIKGLTCNFQDRGDYSAIVFPPSPSRSADEDIFSDSPSTPDISSKSFLESGILNEQRKEQSTGPFHFPLPTNLLESDRDFLLPFNIYSPSTTKTPRWTNLKKSKY